MRVRKRPIVVEATQWWKHGDHPEVRIHSPTQGFITTLEGGHVVSPGDWVIRGVAGEHYPCKPEIFEKTYEKVDE